MLTAELIRSLAPKARQDYVEALAGGEGEFNKWQIDTPDRLAAFLATVLHETGGLEIVRENTAWTKANLAIFSKTTAAKILPFVGNKVKEANAAYGDRMGNERNGTNDDDGWRFRGGGMIQLTGRDSYEKAGKAIGVALGDHPELIEDAKVSLAAACWEFSSFLGYADKGESGFRAVCNGVNRGNPLSTLAPIGWEGRLDWYSKCAKSLGASQAADDTLSLGDSGALVKAVQERLAALGYANGKVDGVFGSRTRAALLAFQAENGLTLDGSVGPQTRAALNSDAAKPMPLGERATETAADLKASGSEIIGAAQSIKTVATVIGGGAIVKGGADQVATTPAAPAATLDLIGTTKDVATEISSWKVIVNLLSETFAWSTSHWYVFAIVAAFALHRWGSKIEARRVFEHVTGLNLSR